MAGRRWTRGGDAATGGCRPLEHFQVRYAATSAVAIRRLFMEFAEVIYREESMAEMEEKIERLEKAKEEEWGGPDRKRFGNLFYYSLVREPGDGAVDRGVCEEVWGLCVLECLFASWHQWKDKMVGTILHSHFPFQPTLFDTFSL